ncbi:MAG: filamentous hemagglutinin N-terminal domain-containing protein, partial [Cyanobacteria bacterium P01_H01_bin.105]
MVCLLNHHRVIPLVVMVLMPAVASPLAQAQSITAANTTTSIQQIDNLYQIDGGSLSGDSTTLFHRFSQFGLLTGETAQFNNPAAVESIIGQVSGGNASIIDGLLAVAGDASLYLVNPAGILFGENAQLNLNGSFSASTATGLAFDKDLLNALSTTDFTLLNGAPTGYVFGNGQGNAVINAGELAVNSGQSLTLLGGQVINTGQLSAPNGDILVMAVPGENLVRLSPTGSLLGLELETLPDTFAQPASAVSISTVP